MNEHEHVRKGIWCVAEGCNGAQYVDGVWMLPESWVVPEAPLRALEAKWLNEGDELDRMYGIFLGEDVDGA